MANSDGMYFVTADTIDECVWEIERVHGPDTFSIKTREQVKIGSILGMGGHKGWKVGYVLRPVPHGNPFPALSSLYQPKVPQTPEDFARTQREIIANIKGPEAAASIPGSKPFTGEVQKKAEFNTEQYNAIMDQLESLRKVVENRSNAPESSEEHPTIVRLRTLLEDNEFSPAYIRAMIDRIKHEFHVNELDDYAKIELFLVRWIAESIRIDRAELSARPQVVVLVGPTGVGKTTTIAKIASYYAYPPAGSGMKPLKVRMVGIDGYRIQAYEQLQHYASILEVPVEKVWQNSLAEKISSYGKDSDVILIDTIGCSPSDSDGISSMRERLELQSSVPQVYLTMTASTKLSDMRDIMTQFEIFDYKSLVVTKIDETTCVGNLISVLWEKDKAVAYITDGQKVPRNFARATQIAFLKKLKGFTIDWLALNEPAYE